MKGRAALNAVLQTAYDNDVALERPFECRNGSTYPGHFDRPHRSSGTEVTAVVSLTPATFQPHLHGALMTLSTEYLIEITSRMATPELVAIRPPRSSEGLRGKREHNNRRDGEVESNCQRAGETQVGVCY